MSLAVGVVSSSKSMGFDDEDNNKQDKTPVSESSNTGSVTADPPEVEQETVDKISRRMSEGSLYTTEDEEDEETEGKIQLGPQFTLKELQEKDKVLSSFFFFKENCFIFNFNFGERIFYSILGWREFEKVERATSWQCRYQFCWG